MVFHNYPLDNIGNNPGAIAVMTAVLLFTICFYVLNKFLKEKKGINLIISFGICIIAAWKLYKESFYGLEWIIVLFFIIIIISFFIKIIFGIYKWIKLSFGK